MRVLCQPFPSDKRVVSHGARQSGKDVGRMLHKLHVPSVLQDAAPPAHVILFILIPLRHVPQSATPSP